MMAMTEAFSDILQRRPLEEEWGYQQQKGWRMYYMGLSENSVPHCTQWFC